VLPVVGKPLYDLLEPDMRVLVDLGYGSLAEGWNQGPADVATPVGFLPTNIDATQLFTALSNGAQQGITNFISDLQNPDTYQIPNIIADPSSSPALSGLVSGAYTFGLTDTATPSLLELLRGFLSNFANSPSPTRRCSRHPPTSSTTSAAPSRPTTHRCSQLQTQSTRCSPASPWSLSTS
jgi:hypothetical protein